MSIIMNRRNIRVNKTSLMRLMSKGLVDRRNVGKVGAYYNFSNIPFAYAKRINSICDVEVYSAEEWNFVRNMDYKSLEKWYITDIKKPDPKPTTTIFNEEIKLEPEIETIKPVIEENIIQEDIQEEAVKEIIPEEVQEETPIDQQEDEIISEEIINIEEDSPEESIIEASEEDNSELEDITENVSNSTEEVHKAISQQNFNFNKPVFRNKKRKK